MQGGEANDPDWEESEEQDAEHGDCPETQGGKLLGKSLNDNDPLVKLAFYDGNNGNTSPGPTRSGEGSNLEEQFVFNESLIIMSMFLLLAG